MIGDKRKESKEKQRLREAVGGRKNERGSLPLGT